MASNPPGAVPDPKVPKEEPTPTPTPPEPPEVPEG